MAIQESMFHLDTSEHHDTDIFIFSDSLRAGPSTPTQQTQQLSLNAANLWTRWPLIWKSTLSGCLDTVKLRTSDNRRASKTKDNRRHPSRWGHSGYAHGYLQAPPQYCTPSPITDNNLPQFQTYLAKLQPEKNQNSHKRPHGPLSSRDSRAQAASR